MGLRSMHPARASVGAYKVYFRGLYKGYGRVATLFGVRLFIRVPAGLTSKSLLQRFIRQTVGPR